MKPSIILCILLLLPRYVHGIVNMIVDVQHPCESIIDCLSSTDSNTVCYQGYCVPCRNSTESCSSSTHCCSGSRCYRNRCTTLYATGRSCRLNRQCADANDYCIDRKCTRCISLWSPCSADSSATPCCVGKGVCRFGICQPAHTQLQACLDTFDCADELVCLSGTCQNPLGSC